MKQIVYRITETAKGEFTLVSVVETNFGGPAINFIASGSKGYCEAIKQRLIGKK